MFLVKNLEYRKKNLRGAKVEDFYFVLDNMKTVSNLELITYLQKYIEVEFGYKPIRE